MHKIAPLVVIVGPTASGKSALSMKIAKKYNGEIICADSRTVYKELDIGTAKPTPEEQAQIPHYLLDVVKPSESFTAAEFKRLANAAIADIHARGKLPIMVGGTGLYVDSVIFDYKFGHPANRAYRKQLNELSVDELQKICSDKNITLPINHKNKRHLIRAIELGGLVSQHGKKLRANTLVVGITTDKEKLKERITLRAKQMLDEGILEEVIIISQKYGWESEAMTGNIYPIFRDVVEGSKTRDQAVEEFVRSDMHLAKRQRTWFKRNPFIFWSEDKNELATKIDQFVSDLNTKVA